MRAALTFTGAGSLTIDARSIQQRAQLNAFRALWIDNASNTQTLTIVIANTQQRLIVAAGAQAWREVLPFSMSDVVVTAVGAGTATIYLYECDKYPDEYFVTAATVTISGTVSVSQIGYPDANYSGSVAAGGTPQVAIPASATTHLASVYNPSALSESLWISYLLTTTLAPNVAGAIELPPGSGWAKTTQNAVWIYAATTGHVYTASAE